MKICECGEATYSYKCSLCQADESVGLAPKAEQQEPVAWFWFDERDGGEWIHIADNQIDANKFGDVKIIPLYTHPQPRKPLTDEAIATVYWGATGQSLRPQDNVLAHKFAKAIESAHDIKE